MVQTNTKDNSHSLTIGRKLKEVRKNKALTIKDVSSGVGVSIGLISQIENERLTPAISTLMKIASFLGVDITYFFQKEEREELFTVMRGKDHCISSAETASGKGDQGYTYEALAFKRSNKHMEPVIATFDAREREDMVFLSHEGEEFTYIIEGKAEFCIKDKSTILEQNDSLYFDSSKPHSYRSLGNRPCRALTVIYNNIP
jgi:transcriptional regulator with XRE-family HTH domain